MSTLVFFFLYKVHNYLLELKNCDCAPQVYVDRLEKLEWFYLVMSLLNLASNVGGLFFSFSKNVIKGWETIFLKLVLAYIFITFIIHIVFVFNVYEFRQNVKPGCDCVDRWEKDYMYFQALIYALPLFILFIGLIWGIVFSLTSKIKM